MGQRFIIALLVAGLLACNQSGKHPPLVQPITPPADTTPVIPADTPLIRTKQPPSTTPTPAATPDTVAKKPLADLPINTVVKLILEDNLVTIENDELAYQILDSLSAPKKSTRNLYVKVLNKIMDRMNAEVAESVGDYALTYVENYTPEFIENSTGFTQNRFETWASHIGIEIILSQGDPKEIFEKSRQTMLNTCKNCDASALDRLNSFTTLIWGVLKENIPDLKS